MRSHPCIIMTKSITLTLEVPEWVDEIKLKERVYNVVKELSDKDYQIKMTSLDIGKGIAFNILEVRLGLSDRKGDMESSSDKNEGFHFLGVYDLDMLFTSFSIYQSVIY